MGCWGCGELMRVLRALRATLGWSWGGCVLVDGLRVGGGAEGCDSDGDGDWSELVCGS